MSVFPRRRGGLVGLALAVAALSIAWGAPGGAGAQGGGELVAQPFQAAPTQSFLGASPQEAPGEVWATAKGNKTLARYTDAVGWETLPQPTAAGGEAADELTLATDASAGRTTPRGGVVVAGADAEGEVLVVRDPGGAAREAPSPGALLEPGEGLFGASGAGRLLAANDAGGGKTGAFVVPEGQRLVLAFDGLEWSHEEICLEAKPGCTSPESGFRAIAIDAGGGEAWLLGRGALPEDGVELFRREAGGGAPVWRQQPLGAPGSLGALYAKAESLGVTISPREKGQPLTVTEAGVWVDAVLNDGSGGTDASIFYDIAQGKVTGSWCDLAAPAGFCQLTLGSELPAGEARSFAWPSGGPYGERAITGIGTGAILSLEGTAFTRIALAGGGAGSKQGAALSAPDEGWLGATPPVHLTRNPESAHLQPWPVPFRRPLTAVVPEPGAPVGALDSEALAVGAVGQVARYLPDRGWEPESLLRASGKRATPTLRAVAWPEPGRAYAVGDAGAMWVWQKATALWEPDPAKPRTLTRANFTGIAFDPNKPSRGYAVGKQGLLLGFGRRWTQEALPPGVPPEANFSSIAFAGDEALATYKFPITRNTNVVYSGGVLSNDGSGWQVDQGAQAALGGAVPQRVAGLPDGGAVIASLGLEGGATATPMVIERQGPGAAWQAAPGGFPGYPTALAAVREAGQVRAILSVPPAAEQGSADLATDTDQVLQQPPPGQAPLLTDPYGLPSGGLVVRQTGSGWRDEQHENFPLPPHVAGQVSYDLPRQPDPVLALLVAPDGGEGWAVGGVTGSSVRFRGEAIQTAGVMRYGPSAAPPTNASTVPIPVEPGTADFALGAGAQCASACADLSGVGIGPDRWLRAAVGTAGQIQGLHAFLYAGPGVAAGEGEVPLSASLDPLSFAREEVFYADRLGAAADSLPVFAAAAESDLDRSGSTATFGAAFSGYGAPQGGGPPGRGIAPLSQADASHAYYAFDSAGEGGTVRVIVLDYSAPSLGDEQRCWLAGQLAAAGQAATPAIVVGERDLAGQTSANAAADAGQVVPILVGAEAPAGCAATPTAASAYLFYFPEENRAYRLSAAGRSIPAYGSGTLGYVTPPTARETDFAGDSGFLLVSVNAKDRDKATNIAPVGVRLVPSIDGLALDAADGTLLRRSQPALFEALARRPLAGTRCEGSSAPRPCELLSPTPYVHIPSSCQGASCPTSLFPEYTFTSSEPDVADFVAPDPGSPNPRNVLLVKEKPVLDSHSGLLCAFNAGTTTVTVSTGGLSYSQQVTVLAGSVQRPCGTTPLRNRAAIEPASAAPVAPAPAPTPSPAPAPAPTLPPPPPPPIAPAPAPAPAVQPAPVPAPTPTPIVPVPTQPPIPLVAIVPPPPPPAVQPTPPSGTSQVQATEREEEEEEAYDLVSQMTAHPSPGPSQVPLTAGESHGSGLPRLVPVLLLIAAAAAAAGIGGRRPRAQPVFQANSNRRYR